MASPASSLGPSQRIQQRLAQALAGLPPRLQVRLSGRAPVQLDGDTLAPDIQLMLSLMAAARGAADRDSLAAGGARHASPAGGDLRRHADRGGAGVRPRARHRGERRPGRAACAPLRARGAGRSAPAARVLPRRRLPLRRPRHARLGLPRCSAATAARTSWRSTTASPPSTASRRPSKTRARRCAGRRRTRTGSARTRRGWAWAAIAPGATSRRSRRSSRRTTAGRAPAIQLLIYPRHGLDHRAPLAGALRRGVPAHARADGLVRGELPRARSTRTRGTPAPRPCWPTTSPGWRRRSSSRPPSTRCATRARTTRTR